MLYACSILHLFCVWTLRIAAYVTYAVKGQHMSVNSCMAHAVRCLESVMIEC